jgi:uncharacterized protein (DUF983 family)
MLFKESKLHSILKGSCPRCHGESMYENNNLLNVRKVIKMNEKCSKCHLKYMIEPSFFYGAMYVSYALNVAIAILVFILSHTLSISIQKTFIAIFFVITLLFPWVMRISRNIYINMFVDYNPNFKL